MKKAFNHIKLDQGNAGKIDQLDAIADLYIPLVQQFVNHLVEHPEKKASAKKGSYPKFTTALPERWQKVAWQQACAIMIPWRKDRHKDKKPPEIKNISLKTTSHVLSLETSSNSFECWLRLTTLQFRKRALIPINLYKSIRQHMKSDKWQLCSGMELNKIDGKWELTLIFKTKQKQEEITPKTPKETQKELVGVDIGMVSMITLSTGEQFGQITKEVAARADKEAKKFARKQKLNHCLEKKNKPKVSLTDGRNGRFVRCVIGKVLNDTLKRLGPNVIVAYEDLSVHDMRMKSKSMQRRLKASQLGFIKKRLGEKLEQAGIEHRAVEPAYSSQTCFKCSFVDKGNRQDQAHFKCLACGYENNADVNGALIVRERFYDDEINNLDDFRKVKVILLARYRANNLPDACGTSVELDSSSGDRNISGECPLSSIKLHGCAENAKL
ncbi:MAG: transposase [Patescibacteria group bacterium]